jgi:cytochrome c
MRHCVSGGLILATAALIAGPASAQNNAAVTGNPEAGKTDFAICSACHQIGPNAQNAVGPELNGVIGSKVASDRGGYEFSDALKNAPFKVWTLPDLQKWLAGPQKLVAGTKMIFPGLPNETQVNDVIAYLAQFNEKGEQKKPSG